MQVISNPEEWLSWLLGPDEQKRKEATLLLGGLTPEDDVPMAPLVAALNSENEDFVFWSAVALGRIGPNAIAAVPALCRLAHIHEHIGIRQSAVSSLSRIAPRDATAKSAVLDAIDDPSPFVRREALQALIKFEALSSADLGRIATAASDPDEGVARWSEVAIRNFRRGGGGQA